MPLSRPAPRALGPTQLAWLRATMPTSFAAAEHAARLAGRAPPLAETPTAPLAVPLLSFRGSGKPLDALALVSAARALLAAHDEGSNRTPAIEALRAALAGWEG